MGPLLALALCLPQIVPTGSEAVIVAGVDKKGRLPLAALALGDGGVQKTRLRPGLERGRATTPGGVLVQARKEGVKLTFPNKQELLVTPAGRVHLRSGEMTLPYLTGLQLLLADGSIVTTIRAPGGRRPLSTVEVTMNGRTYRIWTLYTRALDATYKRRPAGPALLVLGDGRVLYRAIPIGPVVVLERTLCPKPLRGRYAKVRLAVVGDVLRESLRRLPAHAPRRSVQFSQVREAADRLAALAGRIFPPRPIPRPAGAVGELWLQLPEGFRLQVVADDRRIIMGLYRGATETPAVEWLIAGRTKIQFVRPFASSVASLDCPRRGPRRKKPAPLARTTQGTSNGSWSPRPGRRPTPTTCPTR